MQRGDPCGMIQRHSGADDAAPIAALNEIVSEAERLPHQTAHHAGGGLWPKRRFRDTGESVAGSREGAMTSNPSLASPPNRSVREGFDHIEEFRDGTGPTACMRSNGIGWSPLPFSWMK